MVKSRYQWLIVTFFAATLAACGGGSDSDTPDINIENNVNGGGTGDDEVTDTGDADGGDTDVTAGPDTTGDTPAGAPVDETPANPVVVTPPEDPIVETPADPVDETPAGPADELAVIATVDGLSFGTCGTEISDVPVSANVDVPSVLTQGLVGEGLLFSDGDQASNFWSFDVAPGDYVLVLEPFNREVNGPTNLIMEVSTLEDGFETGLLTRVNEADIRIRQLVPVTVESGGLSIGIETTFARLPSTYHLALYSVDDVIPAPFLTDCPDITPISLGDTIAFQLTEDQPLIGQFFQIDLPVGLYDLQIDSANSAGDDTNIIFQVRSMSVSGENDTEESLITVNEVGVTNRTTVTITNPNNAQLLLRYTGPFRDYNVQFSVTNQ